MDERITARNRALAEARKERWERDFNPTEYAPEYMPSPDVRLTNAAEYAAYQLGQINRNLARLIELLEKRTN
jgi:hypothetical protein